MGIGLQGEWTTTFKRKHRRHATPKDFDDRVAELRDVIERARTAGGRQSAIDAACDGLDDVLINTAASVDWIVKFEGGQIAYFPHAGIWSTVRS